MAALIASGPAKIDKMSIHEGQRRKDGATPYQTDYVMATSAVGIIAPRVVTHVRERSVWGSGVSDHAAVIFDVA